MNKRFFTNQSNLKFAVALFSLALLPFLPGCIQVPQTVQDKMSARFEQISADLEKDAKASIAAASEKNDLALTEISAKADDALRKAVEEIQQKYNAELAAAGERLKRLAEQRILLNENAAEEAFAAAQTAQDVATAKLYCLNAINHFPGKALYFQKLVEIQSADTEGCAEDWRQVKNVLELGLYQVSGKMEVETLQELLIQTDEKIGDFEKLEEEEAAEREVEGCREMFSKVNSELDLDRCGANLSLLNERLEILEKLAEFEDAGMDVEQIKAEIRKTSVRLEYYSILKQCENYHANILKLITNRNFSDFPSDNLVFAVAGMISANNNLLTSLGTLDPAALPKSYKSDVEFVRRELSAVEEEFNKKRSKKALWRINSLKKSLNKIDDVKSGITITQKINKRQEVFDDIFNEFSKVYTNEGKFDLEAMMREHKDCLEKWKKKRYKAYQSWAIKRISEAAKEKTSKETIMNFLADIDSSLLEPTVCFIYQSVLDKNLDEFRGILSNWEDLFEVQRELANTPKKSLEDF